MGWDDLSLLDEDVYMDSVLYGLSVLERLGVGQEPYVWDSSRDQPDLPPRAYRSQPVR